MRMRWPSRALVEARALSNGGADVARQKMLDKAAQEDVNAEMERNEGVVGEV